MNRKILPVLLAVFAFGLVSSLTAQPDQHPIATEVAKHQTSFQTLPPTPLFDLLPDQAGWNRRVQEEVSAAAFLGVDAALQNRLLAQPPELLKLQLPVGDGQSLTLHLYQADIFSDEFRVVTASDQRSAVPYEGGAYYWGIVANDEHSLAAITISRNEIMGTIGLDGQTYTLGRLQRSAGDAHVVYKTKDLLLPSPKDCGTDPVEHYIGNGKETNIAYEKDINNCVRMYIEVDYDIYTGKGGVTQAADYVNNAFSQVAILYANESINLVVNEIFVWDVPDPYTGPSTSDYLGQFRTYRGSNYNGDLAHLVGYQGGGGIAYVDVLCNKSFGYGYSDINPSFATVPTYSWTIEVLTHEIGHNLGSRHTHDCVWNGNNTAIDGCGPAAGYSSGCNGPIPDAGTIMSYCHLVSGVGIDFNLGFGPQPGALIRGEVYNAPCLTACAPPTTDDAGVVAIVAPQGTICTDILAPEVEIKNFGTNTLNSVTIEYQLDGGAINTFNWTGSLASGASAVVALPNITFGSGAHTFAAATSNPNGLADEDPTNDSATSSFERGVDQTFYADTDGDSYGDPNNTIVACVQPAGYVTDNTDCNDNDGSAYPGAPCNDGDVCTINDTLDSNCQCSGTFVDSDGDGVCDAEDVCPGGDDTIDSDGDGTPDFCDCNTTFASWPMPELTHDGPSSNAMTYTFDPGSKNPRFSINGLDAVINGKPDGRYDERVVITYEDGNGNPQTYGSANGSGGNSVNVDIQDFVQSVTVTLSDGYDGSAPRQLSVTLGEITYCGVGAGCPDADNDGVCDTDDVCPNFDDGLIGLTCDDGDPCTVNDVYGPDCNCAGTYADSDGDGVCDGEDICPGGDDTIDSDGDGIPDFCDSSNCSEEIISTFGVNPLNHTGAGSASTTIDFPAGNTNVSFSILNLDGKTNGNPGKRYNEVVTVTYVDGNNQTQSAGIYYGESQSTVDVVIDGAVQSVTVSLSDSYEGGANNVALSIDLGNVTSCLNTSVLFEGTEQQALSAGQIGLYPNPTNDYALLTFDEAPDNARVIVRDILGRAVGQYQVAGQPVLRLPVREWGRSSQVFLISIYQEGKDPVTKRLLRTE